MDRHDHTHEVDDRIRRTRATEADAPSEAARPGNQGLEELVQRDTLRSQGAGPLDPEIGRAIAAARSGGTPLPERTRSEMEHHLGADLSAVRVHVDSRADELSRSVQADAFTTGRDVFFRRGVYRPATAEGRRTLGHELTHVVQQMNGEVGGGARVSHPNDPHEREAQRIGDAIARAPRVGRRPLDTDDTTDD